VDDTGAVLQALAAAGMRKSKVAGRAVAFLRAAQNRDGGFGQLRGASSNAQSTSWAVQGLVAVRRKPSGFKRHGHTPLSYLRSLQQKDGSLRYSRTSAQTPVWVTAQVLDAFEQKAFPLRPAPRSAQRATRPRAGGGGAAPAGRARKKPKGHALKPHVAPHRGKAPATTPSPEPTPPQGQATATAPKDAPPSARSALRTLNGQDNGAAWVGGALVAGVAALALWRLARRRGILP
jgi:hypothetical protein